MQAKRENVSTSCPMKGHHRPVLLGILLGLLPALSVCDKFSSETATNERPHNFSIEYHWNSGMQPGPNHFEYTVTINPDGEGKVVMIPDHAADTALRWTETFPVQGKKLDQLYQVMVKNGLFTRRWKPLDPQSPGCSYESIIVTADSKRIVIEGCMSSDEEAVAQPIHSAVASTVPKAIWDKLNRQRDEYVHLMVSIGREFTIKIGEEASIKSERLYIKFRSILEDSRCPKDVECVWIGQARILIAVQQADSATEEFELNTNPGEKRDASYRGYRIELTKLVPYPEGLEKIRNEDYEASLVVTGK